MRKGKEEQTTTRVHREKYPKNMEAGEKCTHRGKMEELQKKKEKKREKKHDKDCSVTHVKGKQNKSEMGITIPASNLHNFKKGQTKNKKMDFICIKHKKAFLTETSKQTQTDVRDKRQIGLSQKQVEGGISAVKFPDYLLMC